MGTCQTQSLGNNQLQLLNENGNRQPLGQTMTKEERKQHKLNQIKFLEERNLKLSENEYDYQNLFTNIRSNIMFDDHQFPPSSISIGDIQKQDDIQWKRIRSLLQHDKSHQQKFDSLSIIRGTLNENNIRKTFFQQMLTYMSSYEGIIEQFIIIEKDDQILELDQSQDLSSPQSPQLGSRKQNQSHVMSAGKRKIVQQDQPIELNNQFNLRKNGMYGVYLFKNKTRQQIVVDDYIPCNNQGTLFLQIQNNQFWPMIIEKAAAKIALSYTNLYNISIQKMVSMFFYSRIMPVVVESEKLIISNLENKLGIIFKNDNSFIFIYGPRNPGDTFYYEYLQEKYFQLNSYGQELPKQKELKYFTENGLKQLVEDKKIQKDSVFMSFNEISVRFKYLFQLNMKIMYPVFIEKSHKFNDAIQLEMCTFNIKEKTNIQISYKLTNNIKCFSLTLLQYKVGEDAIDSVKFSIINIDDLDDSKRYFTTDLEPGKKCLLYQTIMTNQNDKPDYAFKVKLSENILKTETALYQKNLFYEFQKTHSSYKYQFALTDKKVICILSYIGLMVQLNFTYEQFGQIEGIMEFQFDIVGVELDKEQSNKTFYFQEQVHIIKAIRISSDISLIPRMRLVYDLDCQARKEYNEYPNIFSVWESIKELQYDNNELKLFLNLKQINKNDLWYLYMILETRQQVNHKLQFDEIVIQIPNYPNISIKQDGEILINLKQSYLLKHQISGKIEQSDLQKAEISFKKSSFQPIQ